MKLQLIKDLIAIKEVENPFVNMRTDSGIILLPGSSGLANSQETGELEVMTKIIGFGLVTITGPECKTVKVGDGIYYDRRSPQPVPFKDGCWVINEASIRGWVEDTDGDVQQAIDDYLAEQAAESRKTNLAIDDSARTGRGIMGIV